jgi:RimJ/RimL family protein N-acetyltransferase
VETTWEQPNAINLSGERIALGPLREDLAPLYNRWRNDLWVQRTFGSDMRPVSLEETVESTRNQATATDTYGFTIYRHDTWQPIGKTNFHNIDLFQQTAEFGLMIGERSQWNQGFGTETARLMLFYGFRVLNLQAINLSVDGANPGGQRAYEKAGFTHAGRYREFVVVDNQRVDLIHMDCLAREFTDPDVIFWGPPAE